MYTKHIMCFSILWAEPPREGSHETFSELKVLQVPEHKNSPSPSAGLHNDPKPWIAMVARVKVVLWSLAF